MVQNMFRNGFLVRATHTLLTWVTTLTLFLHNTDLRKCEEKGELLLPILFFLVVVMSVLLYFAVSLMDPGFVLSDTMKGSNEEVESMIPQSTTPRLRRCGYCLLQQPMRAKHCQTSAGAAVRSAVGSSHRSVWYLTQCLMGAVVQNERLPAGGTGRGQRFLRGGGAPAGLPPLPGLHQLHHMGVHVPSQDLVPEELRGRGKPFRPGHLLQPVGLFLHLQDSDVGENVPEEQPEPCLISNQTRPHPPKSGRTFKRRKTDALESSYLSFGGAAELRPKNVRKNAATNLHPGNSRLMC
ncbi:probable palmitoyltransferase ZDHHC12 isoform X1 [Xyrichtys novacula]|uniref:Probable palmitoyltransferase ZDHHC12 isoform X1 n=1 Tax=Xyrichtys novacula TaxID=13765 RepID=A0AAV1G8L8_XYRNO|nr:probable palmitoyltransferase ZDHHC12 isoform X1 [Xyrichtys novacula]